MSYTDLIEATPRSMLPDKLKAAESLLQRDNLMPETRAELERMRDALKEALGGRP